MSDDDTLKLLKKRMETGLDADAQNRVQAAADIRFATGEQWPDDIRAEREEASKPCLTLDNVSHSLRLVMAQVRSLNPAIRITPGDNIATKEIAAIYEGLIRDIQSKCDAASVFERGAEQAAMCGIGHWRIRADYEPGLTFNQEILIERIHDPLSVVWDPAAQDATRADARWCMIGQRIPVADFEDQYPDAAHDDIDMSRGEVTHIWSQADAVMVAECYWIEDEAVPLALFADGQTVSGEEQIKAATAALGKPIKERTVNEPRVKWAKITGREILEGPLDVAGRYIPVVAVVGEEIISEGAHWRCGALRRAKDAQMLYNLSRSVGAEITSMQPKAPFFVTPAQIAKLEEHWTSANMANALYLPVNPDPNAPGWPQRVQPPVSSQAVLGEIQMAKQDIQAATGIYDAAMGARSNETSGVAIEARKEESQSANSIYADNMVKSVTHTGRILTAMIPKIYDAERVIRILGPDSQEKAVTINQMFMSMEGPIIENDMTRGIYDARVNVGPTYQTKRAEAAAGMMDFMTAVPPAAPLVADLIAKMQDWPESDRVAERLQKGLLPPGMVEDDEQDPQAQAARQQQAQAAQQEQAAQADMARRKMAADVAKAEAEAREAAADAEKAEAEAAQMTGQIGQLVQQLVAQQLAQITQPPIPGQM